MVVDERNNSKVAQFLGLSFKSLRRKALNCCCHEIPITSRLLNQEIPKTAKTSNHKRAILQWSVIKATFKRLPLVWWSVLQSCNQTRKCSNMPSTCWKIKNILKTEGSMMWRRMEIFSEESSPKMAPKVYNTAYSQVVTSQVLTPPNRT